MNPSRTPKTLTIIAITAALAALGVAIQPSQASTSKKATHGDLHLSISGIQANQGHVLIAVYDDANNFQAGNERTHSMMSFKATQPNINLTLNSFPAGRYAISVLHDTNGNGRMDMNEQQLPREAYAFSQSVGTMSTPTFEEAEFTHRGDSSLTMRLIQPQP